MDTGTQLAVVDGGHATDIELPSSQSSSIIGTMRQLVPQTIAEAAVLARAFYRAGMFGLRSEDQALTLIMTGMELGLAPATAIRGIHVIDGKPSPSADMMVALCKARRDVCQYFTVVESTNERATCKTHRRGDPAPVTQSFTMEDARLAGLIDKANASKSPKTSPWNAHPSKMLLARCKSALARAVYEDLVMGLYTPDELSAGEAYEYAEVDAAETSVASDPEAVMLRKAIEAYLECLPDAEARGRVYAVIAKGAKIEGFHPDDLRGWSVEWLRWLQQKIAAWQTPKSTDTSTGASSEPLDPKGEAQKSGKQGSVDSDDELDDPFQDNGGPVPTASSTASAAQATLPGVEAKTSNENCPFCGDVMFGGACNCDGFKKAQADAGG